MGHLSRLIHTAAGEDQDSSLTQARARLVEDRLVLRERCMPDAVKPSEVIQSMIRPLLLGDAVGSTDSVAIPVIGQLVVILRCLL